MGSNGKDFRGENNPKFRHGLTDGKSFRHPIYTAWQNMRGRCLRPNNPKYPRYGGRGITICEDWTSCARFAAWALFNGWSEGLTLDRIDNDGNYEPSNCQWVSIGKNSRKKSTTKLTYEIALTIRSRVNDGDNVARLAREYSVSDATIYFILNNDTWHTDYQ
jgi:hypothetical protein